MGYCFSSVLLVFADNVKEVLMNQKFRLNELVFKLNLKLLGPVTLKNINDENLSLFSGLD